MEVIKLIYTKNPLICLSKIQKIKQNKIKNFNGKNYKVPIYDDKKLIKEG